MRWNTVLHPVHVSRMVGGCCLRAWLLHFWLQYMVLVVVVLQCLHGLVGLTLLFLLLSRPCFLSICLIRSFVTLSASPICFNV